MYLELTDYVPKVIILYMYLQLIDYQNNIVWIWSIMHAVNPSLRYNNYAKTL